MSADTRDALGAALAAHVADECDGDLALAWVVIAETTTLAEWGEGASALHVTSHGSRFALRGLVETWIDIDARLTDQEEEES